MMLTRGDESTGLERFSRLAAKYSNQICALYDVAFYRIAHRLRVRVGSQIKIRIQRKQPEMIMMPTVRPANHRDE